MRKFLFGLATLTCIAFGICSPASAQVVRCDGGYGGQPVQNYGAAGCPSAGGGGTVTLDQFATAASVSGSGTTATLTTQTVAGANEALYVAIAGQGLSLGTATTVVWDAAGANQSMTSLAIEGNGGGTTDYVQIFCLINPATGNKIATATWTGGNQIVAMAGAAFIGANQTSCAAATPTIVSAQGAAGPVSNPITNSTGKMVIDAGATGGTLSAPTQTAMTPLTNASANGLGMSRSAATGSVTFGWGATSSWADIAIQISP